MQCADSKPQERAYSLWTGRSKFLFKGHIMIG